MNKREAKKFQKLLIAERERLTKGIRQIEEDALSQSAGDKSADFSSYAEVGTDNFERETALRLAGSEAEMVQEIDDALQRIEDGKYGVCEGTGEDIPKARLEVYPWARYCVAYQEQLERDGAM